MSGTANVGIRYVLDDSVSGGLGAIGMSIGGLGGLLDSFIGKWQNLSPVMQGVGLTAAASGALFAASMGIMKTAINAGAEIESAMAQIRLSVHGASAVMPDMQQAVIDMANGSVYGVTEVANAFSALGEKGQNAQAILGGVGQQAIYLAEATGQSGATGSATLLASALQVFNGNASDAKQYADDLSFAFYNGIPSIDGLQQALNQVGTIASTLGIPFGEITSALAFFGQAAMSASQVASSLNYTLQALTDPTNKAQGELQQLGIIAVNQASPALRQLRDDVEAVGTKAAKELAAGTDMTLPHLQAMLAMAQRYGTIDFAGNIYQWGQQTGAFSDKLFNAQGQFIGLDNSLSLLGQTLQNMPEKDKIAAIQQLFNIRSSKAIDDFVANLPTALDKLKQFQQQQGQTSVQDQANVKLHTFNGELTQLKTTLKDALGLMGKSNLGPLEGAFQAVNTALSGFNAKGSKLPQIGAGILTGTTLASGGIFALTGGIFAFNQLHGPMAKGMKSIGAMGKSVFDPLMSLIPNVTDKVTGAVFPWTRLHLTMLGGKASLKDMGPLLKSFGTDLLAHGNKLGNFAVKAFDAWDKFSFKGAASSMFGALKGGIGSVGSAALSAIPELLGLGASMAPILVVALLVAGAIAIGVLMFRSFHGQTQALGAEIGSKLKPIFDILGKTVGSVMKQIKGTWDQVYPYLIPAMNKLFQAMHAAIPIVQFFGKIIVLVLGTVVTIIGGVVIGFIKALPQIINVFTGIITFATGFFNFFNDLFHLRFGKLIGDLGQIFGGIWTVIKNVFGMVLTFLGSFAQNFLGNFINLFKSLFPGISGHLGDLFNNIKDWFNGIPKWLGDHGRDIISGLVNGITSHMPDLMGLMGNLANQMLQKVKDVFHIGSPSKAMHELGTFITQGLVNGITSIDATKAAAQHYAGIASAAKGLSGLGALPSASAAQMTAAQMSAAYANLQVNLTAQLDGKTLYQSNVKYQRGEMQMNGLGRKLR